MRLSLLLLPLLALAACGRASLDKADGSFDRDRYRDMATRECASAMRGANAAVPEAEATRLCGCIMTRVIAGSSDEELRAFYRDDRIPVSRMQAATSQCGGPGGPPPIVTEAPPLEEPPPEEPPPPAPAAPPAAGGGEVADGPDAGAGASAPGGSRARTGALGSYLSEDDYPAAALRNNQQGRVSFTLDISPEGRVTGCQVTESSGSAILDSTTCRIMRSRARYTPARDPRGVAVADRDRAAVRWVLPQG
ncbi:MAG TPA: energy transducer TonB [Allosphingosinicella sp.]|nr:energy transducer TonB [Allosphingosinicella sp.]